MHRIHSAQVSILMHVQGQVLRAAQLGPDFVILRNPIDLPPCEGEIELTIDGHTQRWPVRLPQGCRAEDGRIATATGTVATVPLLHGKYHDPKKLSQLEDFEMGIKKAMSLKISEEDREKLERLAARLTGGNVTAAIERAIALLDSPADERAAAVLNLSSTEPERYLRQALDCWSGILACASADNATAFAPEEWCLIADVCNGTLWEPGVENPAVLLAAEVSDGHQLDGSGYKWFCDEAGELAGSLHRLGAGQPTKAMKAADQRVKQLVQKLAALDYAHVWAMIVAVQWFWDRADLAIDPRRDPWWTVAYRRQVTANLPQRQ